jgi:hypothetical protein
LELVITVFFTWEIVLSTRLSWIGLEGTLGLGGSDGIPVTVSLPSRETNVGDGVGVGGPRWAGRNSSKPKQTLP